MKSDEVNKTMKDLQDNIDKIEKKKTDQSKKGNEKCKTDVDEPTKNVDSKSKSVTRALVEAGDNGILIGKNLDGQMRLATGFCGSGLLPKQYDTAPKVLVAMQMCYEMNLPFLSSVRNIMVINGVPSLWGELPLALVRKSGRLDSIKEYYIDKDYNKISLENKNIDAPIYAAVCIIKRKCQDEKEFCFTQEDKKKCNKGSTTVWNNYEKIMMKRKARALAIKDEFGDILGGLAIAEYDNEVLPENGNDNIQGDKEQLDDINASYAEGVQVEGDEKTNEKDIDLSNEK